MKRDPTPRTSAPVKPAGAGATYGQEDFSPAARRSKLRKERVEDTSVTNSLDFKDRNSGERDAAERALRGDMARPFENTGSI